jgi:bifunctional non-homologous end joining protein LigD
MALRPSSPRRLAAYNAKRNFRRTAEPRGSLAWVRGNRFLVQKHEARRLHYDFRLELDGVLLSWAVARGPSRDPAEKRLALRTEDHPVGYADFEGTIPQGEYGGGTVMLWDRGTWIPRGDPHDGLRSGKLRFELLGERMRGEWLLIRMGRQKRESWLLRKISDEEIGGADDLTDAHRTSIKSGRSMEDIAAGRAGPVRRKAGTRARSSRRPRH